MDETEFVLDKIGRKSLAFASLDLLFDSTGLLAVWRADVFEENVELNAVVVFTMASLLCRDEERFLVLVVDVLFKSICFTLLFLRSVVTRDFLFAVISGDLGFVVPAALLGGDGDILLDSFGE